MRYLIPVRNFLFSVAAFHREVRGQGQLQSSSHGAGMDSMCCSKTLQQGVVAWQHAGCRHCLTTRRKDYCRETLPPVPTLHHQELHCSLTKDTLSFITLHLICYCIFLSLQLPTLPSAVPLVLLLNLHNKAKSKERRGYMNIYIYRYINTNLLFLRQMKI